MSERFFETSDGVPFVLASNGRSVFRLDPGKRVPMDSDAATDIVMSSSEISEERAMELVDDDPE